MDYSVNSFVLRFLNPHRLCKLEKYRVITHTAPWPTHIVSSAAHAVFQNAWSLRVWSQQRYIFYCLIEWLLRVMILTDLIRCLLIRAVRKRSPTHPYTHIHVTWKCLVPAGVVSLVHILCCLDARYQVNEQWVLFNLICLCEIIDRMIGLARMASFDRSCDNAVVWPIVRQKKM